MPDRELMSQATEYILERMRREGFRLDGEVRHDPVVWDVNMGWCAAWARRVRFLIPRAQVRRNQWHTWVELDGLFYDAECLDGTTDAEELQFHDNRPN